MNYIFYLFTLFAILSEIGAQYLFKKIHLSNIKNYIFNNLFFVIGIFLYALTGFFSYKLLQFKELIVVNIIWHIFHFILLFFVGYFIFNEKLNVKKIIATVFGIICILIFMSDETTSSHH
jgi:multidrug transporter EmrE-like cation transporter